MARVIPVLLYLLAMTLGIVPASGDESRIGTRQDRQALFDYLVRKTMERESFSEIKNQRLDLDVEAAMRVFEDRVTAATSEEELFYALVLLSNARKDRHLKVSPVKGGLRVDEYASWVGSDRTNENVSMAPLRFAVDYSAAPEAYVLFVGDMSKDIAEYPGGHGIRVGDILRAVNGEPIARYVERIRPYFRYSTENGFWVKFAARLGTRTPILPDSFYGDHLEVALEGTGGESRTVRIPYLEAGTIQWQGHGERRYDGFELLTESGTFDLYRHSGSSKILLLSWKRFSATLVKDVDALMELAQKNDHLDYDLIWDGTRSGGGGRGAYAIQRLSPKPFKTTFGNLRLSDTTVPFIQSKRNQFEARNLNDGAPEATDDGTWVMEWLEGDVMKGLEAGQDYSNTVPFKTAHAPEWSDGILRPAETHFRGRMVCLLGPHGGSHLDQFASIVVDNDLCPVLGMPAGGYSNTWEWTEIVTFPESGQPVVEFMWSIGHTLRPNGQVLEGNPAAVDEHIPVTRENYVEYYPLLLNRALTLLEE